MDSEMTCYHGVRKMFVRIPNYVPRPIEILRQFFLKTNAKLAILFCNPVKCVIALGSEICIKSSPFSNSLFK